MTDYERKAYVTLLNNLIARLDYNKTANNYTLAGKVTPDEVTSIKEATTALRYSK